MANSHHGSNGKIKFVVMFKKLESVHLHKDVGQIPYQLHKHFEFDTEIVCAKNEEQYKYINEDLAGLKLTFVTNQFNYLLTNARKIDVLMLFHIKTETIQLGLLYKLLNPAGFLYVKYDQEDPRLLYATWGTKHFITQLKRNFYFYLFEKKLDLLSIECQQTYEKLDKISDTKKIHIPNGFDPDIPAYYGIKPKHFKEKENLILLVGRHGSKQKNSELILDALELIDSTDDWKVIFIGPMTSEFEQRKNSFIAKHPRYSDNVVFTGNIEDKGVLFNYYSKAKIFCLPSRWESWGLVCGEALSFGDVLLMSDSVISSYDLTDNGQAGFVVENENAAAWAERLKMLIHDQGMLAEYSQRATEHFQNCFVWKNTLRELSKKIFDKEQTVHMAAG